MSDLAKSDGEKYDGSNHDDAASVYYERPKGIRGFYYHPITQICMLGMVCFMCPGLFNALTGLGGGGQIDTATNSNSNVALYSTFAVVGFFGGSINNKLGARLTLFLGSMGYSLYIGSYLAMNIHPSAGGFVIGAGAVLGICAGMLWSAQGSIMLSYPTEAEKGKFIAIFWAIFNLGAVLGAAVSLGTNFHSEAGRVANGTYIGFLILTLIGLTIPLAMAPPDRMIRSDGTKVSISRQPSWKSEILGLYVCLKTDPMVLLLFPMFFASNWFYTWQFSGYNAALFNIRARSLNNLVYWLSQIVGSVLIGQLVLDQTRFSRRIRAWVGWSVLIGMVFLVHIWAYMYQKDYNREIAENMVKIDIYDDGYVAKIWLYVFMGILDAMWQTTAYWLMGAMSNDPSKLAYFAGFYKCLQSAGSVGVWRADAVKLEYMNIFISTWVLLVVGLLFMVPMMITRIKNTTELEDEAVARMDRSGHVQPTEEVEAKIKQEAAAHAK